MWADGRKYPNSIKPWTLDKIFDSSLNLTTFCRPCGLFYLIQPVFLFNDDRVRQIFLVGNDQGELLRKIVLAFEKKVVFHSRKSEWFFEVSLYFSDHHQFTGKSFHRLTQEKSARTMLFSIHKKTGWIEAEAWRVWRSATAQINHLRYGYTQNDTSNKSRRVVKLRLTRILPKLL